VSKTPAWQRKEGKDPDGGLNAKGRASRGWPSQAIVLRTHAWDETQTDQQEDGERSQLADQQEFAGVEVLTRATH